MDDTQGKILWTPTEAMQRSSSLAHFIQFVQQKKNPAFIPPSFDPATIGFSAENENTRLYQNLLDWSTQNLADFWELCWEYFQVISHSPYSSVLKKEEMPGAVWFEGATLNYAEHIFRNKNAEHPAIQFKREDAPVETISWTELEHKTACFADFLIKSGVKKGDRVAAFLPNSPHAVIAALACLSIGAVWSSCSPDFGAGSVADRFVQIEPKIFIAVDGYQYNGKAFDKRSVVAEICSLLPSVEQVVFIPYLNESNTLDTIENAVYWDTLFTSNTPPLRFEPVPFDHPIWILYSSGTTGVPKAITHGHGGNLLEHLKYLHFHNDVRPGERFFWFSTTGWMMWNFTLASMLSGACIVLYDGSPGYPNMNALWELAETSKIHHFGTSAPFLVACMKAGINPGVDYNLSQMRSIGSTGSPLPPEAYGWVYDHIHKDIWLSSMAGGTDVCTAWVGGNPLLPVYQGEIQCRCLGCSMESWGSDGKPVPVGEVGEMVVTRPMPSMPIYFWNDPEMKRYNSSYFEDFPGVWRHGDWIQFTDHGSLIILGRSDATLNRQGVRIGTAEIYRALDQIEELSDSLIVSIENPDGSDWMPLFVTLSGKNTLNEDLIKKIKTSLRTTYSPRHVPDEILLAPDIPYTISGKKMETPVKRILLHHPLEKAYNPDSMRNPESMQYFIDLAANRS
jgi:acetoacetyl-CoA synthetase